MRSSLRSVNHEEEASEKEKGNFKDNRTEELAEQYQTDLTRSTISREAAFCC